MWTYQHRPQALAFLLLLLGFQISSVLSLISERRGKSGNIETQCSFCNILFQGGTGGLPMHLPYPQGPPRPKLPTPDFGGGDFSGNGEHPAKPSPGFNEQQESGTGGKDIFLGYPSRAEWFPYTVEISITTPNGGQGICTGSIYTPYTIITAAHCTKMNGVTLAPSAFQVYAGGTQHLSGVSRNVSKTIIHPQYTLTSEREKIFDIAMLILDQPLELNNSTIAAIPIAPDQRRPEGTTCYLSAFGSTTGGLEGASGFKQWTPMIIRSDSDCELYYDQYRFNKTTNVCAGGDGVARQCSGDSGGPLACIYHDPVPTAKPVNVATQPSSTRNGTLMLYGVVNASLKTQPAQPNEPCSDPRPGTYAYAPIYISWININAKFH